MGMIEIYLRYYQGHCGTVGEELTEFELFYDGLVRYSNVSKYKKEKTIRRKFHVSSAVVSAVIKIIMNSKIITEDDSNWPSKYTSGKEEIEMVILGNHLSFS